MSESKAPLTEPGTKHALAQKSQPGYYPRWNVMREQAYWDAATRKLIDKRIHDTPPIRFFSEAEAATLTAVFDRVLPQDDRLPAMRIPLLPHLDDRLFHNRIEGFRYEDMPSDQQAYRWACEAFEAMAHEVYQQPFMALTVTSQETLLQSLHDGKPLGAADLWSRMNVERFWTLLLSDACTAYYAHPWAWNEVGYGGPAYPRGYMRLEDGQAEPWEFEEERYAWAAPADTISDRAQDASVSEDQSHHGQAGTH